MTVMSSGLKPHPSRLSRSSPHIDTLGGCSLNTPGWGRRSSSMPIVGRVVVVVVVVLLVLVMLVVVVVKEI